MSTHPCVSSGVSGARRSWWISSHRTSSCRQRVALRCASGGGLAGETSFRTPCHSQRCGIYAASSSPFPNLCEAEIERWASTDSVNLNFQVSVVYLPPDSLQLGQVQATLRSLLPSLCISMSPSPIMFKLLRSLGFSVESPLSCHSSESGSSLIWIPGDHQWGRGFSHSCLQRGGLLEVIHTSWALCVLSLCVLTSWWHRVHRDRLQVGQADMSRLAQRERLDWG